MVERKRKTESLSRLLVRAKSGNPEDLEELYERFKPMILKMVRKMDLQYKEDAKQELIVALFEAVQRYKPNTKWGSTELKRHLDNK